MYSKILVPVDGSDTALVGLKEAIRLAKNQGGKLCLIHVVDELVLDYSYGSGVYAGTVIDSLREGGKKLLDDAQALVRQSGVEVESILVETIGGPAAASIVEQARSWKADLIVMGTHGRRGLRRLALGSDAEQVIRSSPVPILLVRG
jgi:nucleotide-binding universal stress UspA family protein